MILKLTPRLTAWIVCLTTLVLLLFLGIQPEGLARALAAQSLFAPLPTITPTPTNPTWGNYGPEGGWIRSIGISPNFASDSTVFVAPNDSGIHKSSDAGNSWRTVSIPMRPFFVLPSPNFAIDQTVFVGGSFGQLWRSLDAGESWEGLDVQGASPKAIAFSPNYSADQTILVLTHGNGLLHSTDGGSTWAVLSVAPGDIALAVAPSYPAAPIIYVGGSDGLYKTFDNGQTWTKLFDYFVTGLALSPNFVNDNLILVCCDPQGLVKTTDDGQTWLHLDAAGDVIRFSPHYAADGTIFITRRGGVFRGKVWRSTDQGATWQELNHGYLGGIEDLAVSPNYASDGTLYIGIDIGVVRTTDAGATWEYVNTGIRRVQWIRSITTSPHYENNTTLYAAGSGLFKSMDGGLSWQFLSRGLEGQDFVTIGLSPNFESDGIALVGASCGFSLPYRTTDGGATWSPIYGLFCPPRAFAFSSEFGSDQTVFAATGDSVYLSTDAGVSWVRKGGGITRSNTVTVAASPNFGSDQTLFAVVGEDGVHGSLFRSTDGSESWSVISDLPSDLRVLAVSPEYETDQTVIVGTFTGTFRTTDGGNTWSQISTQLAGVTGIAFSPYFATDNSLFAIAGTAVLRSQDGGVSWTALVDSIPFPQAIGVGAQASQLDIFVSPIGNSILQRTLAQQTVTPTATPTETVLSTPTPVASNTPTIPPATECTTPPPDLIAWWPGDSNAEEIVGTFDGTLVNGASFTSGVVGDGFYLPGPNGYVSTSQVISSGPFTMDLWMKNEVTQSGLAVPISQGHSDGTGIALQFQSWGAPSLSIVGLGNPRTMEAYPSNDTGWHHVAVTHDSNDINRVYLDGLNVPIRETTGGPSYGPSELSWIAPFVPAGYQLYFGQDYANGGRFWNGRLDEVEIFNRALSPAEIQAIYNTGSFGKCKESPTATPTPLFPTETPTDIPSPTPTETSTVIPTDTPTVTLTPYPTDSPTNTPTDTPPVAHMRVASGSYVGNDTDNYSITGLGFPPDVVFIKGDLGQPAVVRMANMPEGISKLLNGGGAVTNRIESLDADGFTIGTDADVNKGSPAKTYYWIAFKAAPGEMTLGSYTGNHSGQTISGVGFQPDYVFVIAGGTGQGWQRSATTLGVKSYNFGNADNNHAITGLAADGFTVGTSDQVNDNSKTFYYIAWNSNAGTMATGTYAGNSVDNRELTDVGFPPEWVIIKKTEGGSDVTVHHPLALGSSNDDTMKFNADNNLGAGYIKALISQGFRLGTKPQVNGGTQCSGPCTYFWVAFKDGGGD